MKRSKMIKEITKILKTYQGSILDKETAKEILDKAEELGMLPPTIVFFDAEIYTGTEKFIQFQKNEWEKE